MSRSPMSSLDCRRTVTLAVHDALSWSMTASRSATVGSGAFSIVTGFGGISNQGSGIRDQGSGIRELQDRPQDSTANAAHNHFGGTAMSPVSALAARALCLLVVIGVPEAARAAGPPIAEAWPG